MILNGGGWSWIVYERMVSKCSDAYGIQKAECGVTVDSRLVHERPGGAAIGFIRHIGEYLEAGEG